MRPSTHTSPLRARFSLRAHRFTLHIFAPSHAAFVFSSPHPARPPVARFLSSLFSTPVPLSSLPVLVVCDGLSLALVAVHDQCMLTPSYHRSSASPIELKYAPPADHLDPSNYDHLVLPSLHATRLVICKCPFSSSSLSCLVVAVAFGRTPCPRGHPRSNDRLRSSIDHSMRAPSCETSATLFTSSRLSVAVSLRLDVLLRNSQCARSSVTSSAWYLEQ